MEQLIYSGRLFCKLGTSHNGSMMGAIKPGTSIHFPFSASSALEDVVSILRYINVFILFYSILLKRTDDIQFRFHLYQVLKHKTHQ